MHPLVVLVGPSAAGKSTLARQLAEADLVTPHATWTTRPPRPDEASVGGEHVFVEDHTFDAAEAEGRLAVVVTLFGHRYGLPPLPLVARRPLLLVGRSQLLPLLAPLHPAPLVYALTAPDPTLQARAAGRSLPRAEQDARVAYDGLEAPTGAHRVFDTTRTTATQLLTDVADALRADVSRDTVPRHPAYEGHR